MGHSGLTGVVVLALLSGCAPKSEPTRLASDVSPSQATKSPPAKAEKPPAKDMAKAAAASPTHPLFDEFKLPLVIHVDAPAVPPEIEKPSPPIEQPPKPP